jgi:glutamine synthetase
MVAISYNRNKYKLLENIQYKLQKEFGLIPCIGAEIEFYLDDDSNISLLQEYIGHKIKPEKGKNQFEINFDPSCDVVEYAKYIELTRSNIKKYSKQLGGKANFSSKPYKNDYGNSMHIHLNFLEDYDIEKYARILCHYLPYYLATFLPKKRDIYRLDERFMAPTRICYGGNNRTVAIRIPDSLPKRLEHRLPAASSDPAKVIYAILESITQGLTSPTNDYQKHSKIYGNAFDEQYNLIKILQYF